MATAFAPATVANVAVGFDLLGFALDVVGDRVTVRRTDEIGVRIDAITGVVTDLPRDPERNTATVGLVALARDLRPDFGFSVSIEKGIALGSGMGGSAASAVAAVVAAAALVDAKLSTETLLGYALMGEAAASGTAHGDNAAPCLYGGLVLCRDIAPVDVVRIPVPSSIAVALVHPHLAVETRAARAILRRDVPLRDHVRQSAALAGFLAGCFTGDAALIGRSMSDVIVEPQRAHLVPGFLAAKRAALDAGALGCSLSGSGPSVFAWGADMTHAHQIRDAIAQKFGEQGIACDAWVAPVASQGARLVGAPA